MYVDACDPMYNINDGPIGENLVSTKYLLLSI